DFFEKFHRLISDPPLPRFSQRDGLQIDEQLDLRDLCDWQVGRLLALENAAGVNAGKPVAGRNIACVAREAAGRNELAIMENRRYCVMERQRCKLFAPATKERITAADYEPGHSTLSNNACEYRLEVSFGTSVQDMEPRAKRAGRRLRRS